MVCRRVEVKGHQKCVEKVESIMADFDQPVQQALQVPTVHLHNERGGVYMVM